MTLESLKLGLKDVLEQIIRLQISYKSAYQKLMFRKTLGQNLTCKMSIDEQDSMLSETVSPVPLLVNRPATSEQTSIKS